MIIPTLSQAETLLSEAELMNPGPWAAHSRVAALAAQCIAAHVEGMDSEAAYILGLLHDVGRRHGVAGMRHITDGYQFMIRLGYPDAARICMTHSFPLQDSRSMLGWDGSAEDLEFVDSYISQVVYDEYDLLIQLADALALPEGCCLIEKRMVDVAMRYGFNQHTLAKWQAHFLILQHFEQKIGQPVYALLPGVVETTFATSLPQPSFIHHSSPGTVTA